MAGSHFWGVPILHYLLIKRDRWTMAGASIAAATAILSRRIWVHNTRGTLMCRMFIQSHSGPTCDTRNTTLKVNRSVIMGPAITAVFCANAEVIDCPTVVYFACLNHWAPLQITRICHDTYGAALRPALSNCYCWVLQQNVNRADKS